MFKKILVVYSEKISRNHADTVTRVADMLKGKDFKVVRSHALDRMCFERVQLIITIGGDGAVIRAAAFAGDCPLLGINSEPEMSEGALTGITDSELDFLDDVLAGRFRTILRQRARVLINGNPVETPALNEVYVGAASQFHTSRYIIRYRGKEEEHRSSGVLVSTGSGSRAWYSACGGNPFPHDEPRLEFVVREVFRGRIFRPEITGGEIKEGEKIRFESRRDRGGIVALDANLSYEFNYGDVAEVSLSYNPLKAVVK